MPKIKYCRQDFRSLAPFGKAPPGNAWLAHLMLLAFCIANWKEARLPDDTQYTPTNFRSMCKKAWRYIDSRTRKQGTSMNYLRHEFCLNPIRNHVARSGLWHLHLTKSRGHASRCCSGMRIWDGRQPGTRQLRSKSASLLSCPGIITSSFTLTIPSSVISISKKGFVAWPRVCLQGTGKLQHACMHTHYYCNVCLQ